MLKIKTSDHPNQIMIYAGKWTLSVGWRSTHYWSGRSGKDTENFLGRGRSAWVDRKSEKSEIASDVEVAIFNENKHFVHLNNDDDVQGYVPVDVVFQLALWLEEMQDVTPEEVANALDIIISSKIS